MEYTINRMQFHVIEDYVTKGRQFCYEVITEDGNGVVLYIKESDYKRFIKQGKLILHSSKNKTEGV